MVTSARSKELNKRGQPVDRPFDPRILAKAESIANQYKVVLEFEDGCWFGHGLEMPGVVGDGNTIQAAAADAREALITVVAYMLEEGQTPPRPARRGRRSVRVNVRLTPDEKELLETRAEARGFSGLSDYIRTSVLTESER